MSCIPICSNSIEKNVTKADLDRFTDKIENVLSNVNGRCLFKEFLRRCDLEDGENLLNIYERILTEEAKETITSDAIHQNVLKLINRLDEFDEQVLLEVDECMEVGNLRRILDLTKHEIVRLLHHDYNTFRKHYSKRRSPS